jgi:hypothetical protein
MGYLEALELFGLVVVVYLAGYFYGLEKGRGRGTERKNVGSQQRSWKPAVRPCAQCGEPNPVAGDSFLCTKCGAYCGPKSS